MILLYIWWYSCVLGSIGLMRGEQPKKPNLKLVVSDRNSVS